MAESWGRRVAAEVFTLTLVVLGLGIGGLADHKMINRPPRGSIGGSRAGHGDEGERR